MKIRILLLSLNLLFLGACETSDTESEDDRTQSQAPITETVNDADYQLLAVNDLGMHCADLDYQVFSILPPYNVLHAQVIRKGIYPEILTEDSVSVTYEAISNPHDPVANDSGRPSITTTSTNEAISPFNSNYVLKSNFWEPGAESVPANFANAGLTNANQSISIGGETYAPLYPGVQVADDLMAIDLVSLCVDSINEYYCPSLLNLFEPLADESGLPVPDLVTLKPSDGSAAVLEVNQQLMPGLENTPQPFNEFVHSQVFFPQFDFGAYLEERNWFAAEGIPILPIDDAGRTNPYPMMRVKALENTSQQELARLDVVLPVASEADCQNCHVQVLDCQASADFAFPEQCNGSAVNMTAFDVMTLDDNPPGDNGLNRLQNTAKINILRLHDVKHGHLYQQWGADKNLVNTPCDPAMDANSPNCLANQTPLQCAQCHYTPALDLAQVGPVDEPEQGPHGRQQLSHQSMSRVIHAFHAGQSYTDPITTELTVLFPDMPSPNDPLRTSGVAVNDLELEILNQTCYQCHPGKSTECLRGAMVTGGVICQDCHGDMDQVGNDFSIHVNSSNPGQFILDGALRVPWASEPGCQSCHTGDAVNKNHPPGAIVAADGIRLLQAYNDQTLEISLEGTPQSIKTALMYHSSDSRFRENIATNHNGESVDVLYRFSKDRHGGVMCEGCHNSTHAIWPNQNPYANDNVAAQQLQGHSGTLAECGSCHEDQDLGNTLGGPHGMHPVGGGRFADGGHEELYKQNERECQACHGIYGEGTVLSRAFNDRSYVIEECEKGSLCPDSEQENFRVQYSRGVQISCALCHENPMDERDDDD